MAGGGLDHPLSAEVAVAAAVAVVVVVVAVAPVSSGK